MSAASTATPLGATVRAALAALADAHVFDLGAPISESMPQWPEQGSRRLSRAWMVAPEAGTGGTGLTFAVEAIEASLHTSTHIDAVVHAQLDGRIHGGQTVAAAAAEGFFREGGVESIPPILVPFVLADVAGAAGLDALPDDAVVSAAEVEAALGRDGLSVEPGSAVLVRTGKMRDYSSGDAYLERQPGLSPEAGIWLADRGMTLLGSDTAGTDPIPTVDLSKTVHAALLVERGIHLVENLVLDELAASGRRRGVFVCLPLRLVGATGSWVRPVAIA